MGTYEGLKNVKLVEPAVFYLNSHGWTIDVEAQLFVIPTLTPWPWLGIGVSDEFKDDLANRRIVRQSAEQVDKNNRVRMVSVVAITQYFVQKYWKFAKNALVYIDCCSLGGDSFGAMDFRQSLLNAGAGCVVAWSGRSNSGWCFPAVTKFFDLSLGTHRYSIDTPNQRPFPPEQVFSELQKLKADKGWALKPDDDPKKVAKRFLTIWPKAPTGGQLAPSIKNIEVTERGFENPLQGESKMKIFGAFGDVSGHVIEVTVADVRMSGVKPIVGADGLIEAIECNLLSDPAQKGFAGKVIVIIDEHESNAVPLTLWRWTLRSDVVVAKAANAYLQHTVEWDIYIRADVHPYRTEAHGPMTKPGPIAIRAAPGSKVKFTVTAVGIPVSRPTAELPYGLHKVPLVVGGTPVEFIDGYLFEGTMDVTNNRVDIANFYGGYYYVDARPPIPQALVLDPGYIAIPTQSPNVSFQLKDGFVIDAKFLTGSIPDSTFNAKESKPLYGPSPADNPGEDVR